MIRMIERWFPCAEVSAAAAKGWGLGRAEKAVFTWFAARPPAQARAAVLTSLLAWPEDNAAQRELQDLVTRALASRQPTRDAIRAEIERANPAGAHLLDPFSGRGMIPLEAARFDVPSYAMDYSPVAVLASELLSDYPFRPWADEPALPYAGAHLDLSLNSQRLLGDIATVLAEVGRRHKKAMSEFYPATGGRQPWGYLWATTLPCQECGARFPLVGSYELRKASQRRGRGGAGTKDPGQSFYVATDADRLDFRAVVHEGPPRQAPTLSSAPDNNGRRAKGKSAVCSFCSHVHSLSVHQRLAGEGLGEDRLLVVADLDTEWGKQFREPTQAELDSVQKASIALAQEPEFAPRLPAIPDEEIPLNNGATIRPQLYGSHTYGEVMGTRQTLSFVKLARAIAEVAQEIIANGNSVDYARALSGYAAANLVRKIRYSTRGATLYVGNQQVADVFLNEGTISFSYDFFETGIGDGPGTWDSLADNTKATLRTVFGGSQGTAAQVERGSAADAPYRAKSMAVVVTDPPYDSMVYYSDSSDLFFVWLKRALHNTFPELLSTADPHGLQEKRDEIIVKEHGKAPGEHRDRAHYDARIAKAFSEMRRLVRDDGLVTIVFGHGEPEVWQRLLSAIQQADLVMTASWPANTESGGQQGKANIETTLTMACRPAPPHRAEGRKGGVEGEIREEIKARYPDWERWGLAPTDMLMAAAGPAMEVVGRYSSVLDARGEPVDISTFLPLARAAVQEAMAVEVEHHPLETFDARTRFALWWVRLYGRQVVAKSELRWQALASSMDLHDVRDLVPDVDKGCQFIVGKEVKEPVTPESSVIDVALAMVKIVDEGLQAVGEVLLASDRDTDDAYLWAAIKFLADRLPDADADAIACTRLLRNRAGIGSATQAVVTAQASFSEKQRAEEAQMRLL